MRGSQCIEIENQVGFFFPHLVSISDNLEQNDFLTQGNLAGITITANFVTSKFTLSLKIQRRPKKYYNEGVYFSGLYYKIYDGVITTSYRAM